MRTLVELYIHIPFCIRKCRYCDFLSFPSERGVPEEYVELLLAEINRYRKTEEPWPVSTIFLGGGTPSLLLPDQAGRIFEALNGAFRILPDAEITMEANPGTISREKLQAYRKAGVNRLSLGLQSIHQEELAFLGRIHTFPEFQESFSLARECGFSNISVDLISAVPGQTVEGWKSTLETVTALEPEHISAYSLIIEPGTPFYELYGEEAPFREDIPPLPGEEADREMYHLTKALLKRAGYERYEISNYAKPGFACRHNLGYWERREYVGLGPGAASLVEGVRFQNPEEMDVYREQVQAGSLPFWLRRTLPALTPEETMEETIFLGLRKMAGITEEEFYRQCGKELMDVYREPVEKMERLGMLAREGGRIFLTEQGLDVSNAVFVEFML